MAILTTEENKIIQYLAVYSLESLNAIFSETGKVHKEIEQPRALVTHLSFELAANPCQESTDFCWSLPFNLKTKRLNPRSGFGSSIARPDLSLYIRRAFY